MSNFNNVYDLSEFELQPSDEEEQIKKNEKDPNDITDEEYKYMLNEINYFNPNPSKSLYNILDKNPNAYEWRFNDHSRPEITKPINILFKELKFYSDLISKNILSPEQQRKVNYEIKEIYRQLKANNQYDFFLKHGYDGVDIDKNEWRKKNSYVKFYQREDDLNYYNSQKEDFIDINLPIDKWWINGESRGDFILLRDNSNFEKEFVDINSKLSVMYDADHYVDDIVISAINNVKKVTNDSSIYEYKEPNSVVNDNKNVTNNNNNQSIVNTNNNTNKNNTNNNQQIKPKNFGSNNKNNPKINSLPKQPPQPTKQPPKLNLKQNNLPPPPLPSNVGFKPQAQTKQIPFFDYQQKK